jgi:hypothetical protein
VHSLARSMPQWMQERHGGMTGAWLLLVVEPVVDMLSRGGEVEEHR